ncbi:hypothetical protein H8L32_07405 [Undibacterium sp. CY18W]|uniref:Type IV pilus assembly protein PilN n=1 Tax=Undibacterium hunanense TaxID=2762292 RepID=A0ABR6ZN21_9BURK|nr:hypothetical protein [Undibacterium hunanense]MBC3917296.1 hypothetical protein [Undibacterium hunanense]
MRPVQIDFAENNNPWRWDMRNRGVQAFLLLMSLALCVAILIWHGWQGMQGERVRLDEQHAQMQSGQGAELDQVRKQPGNDETLLLRQSEFLRNLRWEAIFQAFEAAPGAGLDAFEPELTRGVVRVQAHVGDVLAMQAYLRELQKSPVFLRVNLLRHETQETRVNFHFEAILAEPYRLPVAEVREAS